MTRIAPYLLFIGTFCLVLIEGLLLLIHFFQCSISGIIHNHSHCIIPRRVRWDLLQQAKQKHILLEIMRNTRLVNTFFSQTRIKLCHFTQWSLTPFIVTQLWAPGGGTRDFKWRGWSKDFFGFEIFDSRIFLDMKIWQVFFGLAWFE